MLEVRICERTLKLDVPNYHKNVFRSTPKHDSDPKSNISLDHISWSDIPFLLIIVPVLPYFLQIIYLKVRHHEPWSHGRTRECLVVGGQRSEQVAVTVAPPPLHEGETQRNSPPPVLPLYDVELKMFRIMFYIDITSILHCFLC